MDREMASAVAAQLTTWNVPAKMSPVGMFSAAVRVQLGSGREALWDCDAGSGLTAQVLRDGMLVGFVSELPASSGLTAPQAAWLIATADYDLSPWGQLGPARPAARR
jgi:hypothetical protein